MAILVNGGAGYIGSHTCVQLLNAGYDIVVADNLVNSDERVIGQIKKITGKEFPFYSYDLKDDSNVKKLFTSHNIDTAIHFAALKSVAESVADPLIYYENNLVSSMNLIKTMSNYNVRSIVFSSSACVYGDSEQLPFSEDCLLRPVHPYGITKMITEKILQDVYNADPRWRIAILRYFNPIGAHESGLIGENPRKASANLMPHIINAALGKTDGIVIYGDDYNTKDGTGIRDYLHVEDLAVGHIAALKKIKETPGVYMYNLGTGSGHSVMDLIQTFEKVNNVKVPYRIQARRDGDAAASYADVSKAEKELGWAAKKTLEEMCRDAWNYAKNKK